MTCIVGLEHDGKVWMGGDSAATADDSICKVVNPKVFDVVVLGADVLAPSEDELFLIGFSGSNRMGQILEHCFRPPIVPLNRHLLSKYMVTEFVDELRTLFTQRGYHTGSDEDGDDRGGTFLVGVKGRLFVVENDFSITEPNTGKLGRTYYAIGSGGDLALGSLYSTQGWASPEKRVLSALNAAWEFNNSVRPPFTVRTL